MEIEHGLEPTDPRLTASGFWRLWFADREFFLRMCIQWLRGNHHDAEDVMSAGALNALEFVSRRPATIHRFRPWMLRILYNLCVGLARSRSRYCLLDTVELIPLAGASTPSQEPEQALVRREMSDSMARAISRLPSHLYEAFVLRFFSEIRYDEISQLLRIKPQAARKRIQLAREFLRLELARSSGLVGEGAPEGALELAPVRAAPRVRRRSPAEAAYRSFGVPSPAAGERRFP